MLGLDVKPVLLWSDCLIWLLVVALALFVFMLKARPQTRENWRKVFASRVGAISFLVMLFYILIALLDSIHYRQALQPLQQVELASENGAAAQQTTHYSNEVLSLLDYLLLEMKQQQETTYSAPFALYSFAKENQEDNEGRIYRAFPRLHYGGGHLESLEQRWPDIAQRSLHALGIGCLYLAVLIFFIQCWLRPRITLPWPTVYGVLTMLVLGSVWVLELGKVYHILGTDKVGIDVLYQSIKSIRTGVLIGTLATLLALPFAIGFGIAAGYFRGWVDDVVQYLYTTLSSVPDILLISASVLVIDVFIEVHSESFELLLQRADMKFLALCAIFGLTSWTGLCRLLRAETLKVSQLDYVEAARAFGVSHSAIIIRHILPNVMHLVMISLVLNFSSFVLAESILSYIGVGIDASMNSWGNMINAARQELSRDPAVWWSITAAFLLMFILVLAANLFADRVRDAFDPRYGAVANKGGVA